MRFINHKNFIQFLEHGLQSKTLPSSILLISEPNTEYLSLMKEFTHIHFHPLDIFMILTQDDTDEEEKTREVVYGIEQIRRIKEFLQARPWGDRRIILIDAAHRLKTEAQNAFLKILEEPPTYAFLILMTPKPMLLLPTVRSRLFPITIKTEDTQEGKEKEIQKFFNKDFFEKSQLLQSYKSKTEFEDFYRDALFFLHKGISNKISSDSLNKELTKDIALAKTILFLEKTLFSLNLNARLQLEHALLNLFE